MARIRTIKPEFFTSSDILALSPLARLFYVSLWCESDREGRLKWDVETLKFRYLPKDSVEIQSLATELTNGGLIEVYTIDGKEYAEVISFKNHQIINNRESDSVLPPRVKAASPHVKAEGKEGREGKGREHASLFDAFWDCYPKKVGKADAEKAFVKLSVDDALQVKILAAVKIQTASPSWLKEGGAFIPHAATWLNGKRWLDLVNVASGKTGDTRPAPPDGRYYIFDDPEHPEYLRTGDIRFKGAK